MARGSLARGGCSRSEAGSHQHAAITRKGGGQRLRPRPAEALAHRDEMFGRDGLGEGGFGQRRLAAGMLAEGLAEGRVAVARQVAVGRDHGAGDIGGDLMGGAEGQAFRPHQRIGKLGDGDAGAADVLGDAPPVDL